MMDHLPCCTVDETLELLVQFEEGSRMNAARNMMQIVNAKEVSMGLTPTWTVLQCYGKLNDLYCKMIETKS